MTPVTNRPPARGNGATADDEIGMIWWNRLSERDRTEWSRAAGNTGVAADAWAAFRASQNHHRTYRE